MFPVAKINFSKIESPYTRPIPPRVGKPIVRSEFTKGTVKCGWDMEWAVRWGDGFVSAQTNTASLKKKPNCCSLFKRNCYNTASFKLTDIHILFNSHCSLQLRAEDVMIKQKVLIYTH